MYKRRVNIQIGNLKKKREKKIMPTGGREPAYQKTLKYAVTERGETN